MATSLVTLSLVSGCFLDHDSLAPPPECDEPGEVPRSTADPSGSGPPLRWEPPESCLRVTYDPSLEEWAPVIAEATLAWETDCHPICFAPPVAATQSPSEPETGSVHFHPGEGAGPLDDSHDSDDLFLAQSRYRRETGEILAATVFVRESMEPSAARLVHQVGHVLGLAHVSDEVDSVMVTRPEARADQPTCLDLRSACSANE